MKSTQLKKGSYSDYLSNDFENYEFHFRLIKPNNSSTYVKSDGMPMVFSGSHKIQALSVINEKIKDKNGIEKLVNRTIRLIPGEQSIYQDEQSDDKDVPKNKSWLIFTNGKKIVPGTERATVDFMMKCNMNLSNPKRRTAIGGVPVIPMFELIDTEKIVNTALEKDQKRSEVENFCWKGDFDKVLAMARVVGINMTQKPNEIRYELKNIAIRDIDKFESMMKDPSVKRKHIILEAIDMGLLSVNDANNSISWTTNPESPLHVAPTGISIVDEFSVKLGTDPYQSVLVALTEQIKPAEAIVAKPFVPEAAALAAVKVVPVVNEPEPEVFMAIESEAEIQDIAVEAQKLGLITFTPPYWFSYRGEKGAKMEGMVNKLKTNPELLKNLRYEIAKIKATA